MELSGGAITNVQTLTTSRINSRTVGVPIQFLEKTDLDNKDIQQVATLTATTVNATNTGGTLMTGNLDLGENNIERVIQADVSLLNPYGGTSVDVGGNINMVNATNKNISNVGTLSATNVDTTILDAGNVNITGSTVSSTGVLEFKSGASDRVNFKSDNGILSIENVANGGNVELEFAQFGFETFSILKNSSKVDICQSGLNNIEMTTDCFGAEKKVILDPTNATAQFRDYNVDMNSNDIL